ncbi:hypothetical protein AB0B50_00315 [Streptomyces sp. NPDC041068]|uniref:hypothetical protein n=1 Tax=Streptomyces sp. NPDC041068 TaxID=3155130 RepID=UPI0033DC5EC5
MRDGVMAHQERFTLVVGTPFVRRVLCLAGLSRAFDITVGLQVTADRYIEGRPDREVREAIARPTP